MTHINLNDGTVEGLAIPDARAFSVQYHPESSPGSARCAAISSPASRRLMAAVGFAGPWTPLDQPLSYQPYLDQLIAFASSRGARKPDLLDAKAEYFQLTGEVFEDDKQFEMRMASFLDYYLFDRVSPETEKTPAQELFELRLQSATPERGQRRSAASPRRCTGSSRCASSGKGIVRLRELFSGKDFDVTERRHIAGLEKGDILEARLIPFGGAAAVLLGVLLPPARWR